MKKANKGDSGSGQIEFCFRVLGYQVDSRTKKWGAHCLETDLVGYGKNFDEALGELRELTNMQISFARFKNQPALLDRPAPAEILEIYNALVRALLQQFTVKGKVDKERRVASMPFSMNLKGTDFSLVQT
jgi:hypothetical protein